MATLDVNLFKNDVVNWTGDSAILTFDLYQNSNLLRRQTADADVEYNIGDVFKVNNIQTHSDKWTYIGKSEYSETVTQDKRYFVSLAVVSKIQAGTFTFTQEREATTNKVSITLHMKSADSSKNEPGAVVNHLTYKIDGEDEKTVDVPADSPWAEATYIIKPRYGIKFTASFYATYKADTSPSKVSASSVLSVSGTALGTISDATFWPLKWHSSTWNSLDIEGGVKDWGKTWPIDGTGNNRCIGVVTEDHPNGVSPPKAEIQWARRKVTLDESPYTAHIAKDNPLFSKDWYTSDILKGTGAYKPYQWAWPDTREWPRSDFVVYTPPSPPTSVSLTIDNIKNGMADYHMKIIGGKQSDNYDNQVHFIGALKFDGRSWEQLEPAYKMGGNTVPYYGPFIYIDFGYGKPWETKEVTARLPYVCYQQGTSQRVYFLGFERFHDLDSETKHVEVRMPFLYVGQGNKAKRINRLYVGVNGKTRLVSALYAGVNSKAKRVYYPDSDMATDDVSFVDVNYYINGNIATVTKRNDTFIDKVNYRLKVNGADTGVTYCGNMSFYGPKSFTYDVTDIVSLDPKYKFSNIIGDSSKVFCLNFVPA